jgi:HAD superfamily hydrolase (TIGR01509 family)
MILAHRLAVPDGVAALLFDMDGVLVDTLTMDVELVGRLINAHCGAEARVPESVIKANFPYPVPEFWPRVLDGAGIVLADAEIEKLVAAHEEERRHVVAVVHEGIVDILQAAREAGLSVGAVSNNPVADIESMLAGAGLRDYFDTVVGNDLPGFAPKPAPDMYAEGARRLGRPPEQCMAIEDSPLGIQSASSAGCYTVAVATGAGSFAEFEESSLVSRCYTDFRATKVVLGDDGITSKSLVTPNDFVSHMIEHIAWRLGRSVDVLWTSDDWYALGQAIGRQVALLPSQHSSAAALGMIDDGSAEVTVRKAEPGRSRLTATQQVDLDWFLSLRCEQLPGGWPLVEMLSGLSDGAGVDLDVTVASLEDPHHTWEGVYRAVGIALSKMCGDAVPTQEPETEVAATLSESTGQVRSVESGWVVDHVSTRKAGLSRRTSESHVRVQVAMGQPGVDCRFDVADSIHVDGMADLLREFATGAGLSVDVDFLATRLSSSHVVAEDIGLAIGRAIRGIAVERMENLGIQGAGSNVSTMDDLARGQVRVGVSMEGRKFWKYVPFAQEYGDFRKSFLIGHTMSNGLFSEDLDDFVDGFAGGMHASVMVHFARPVDPGTGWPLLFRALGEAVAELLSLNPSRRGLIAGVKATLA